MHLNDEMLPVFGHWLVFYIYHNRHCLHRKSLEVDFVLVSQVADLLI